MAQQFGVTAGGTNSVSYDTTEGKVWVWQTANSTGVIAGLTQNSAGGGFGRRLFGGRMKVRFKIDSTTSARFYFGLTSATSTPISETILANGDSGMLVGFRAADTNFFVFTHAGSGSMTATQLNAGGAVAKTVTSAFHTLELKWTAAGNLDVIYDGTTHTISTDLPATSTDLYPFLQVQTSAAVQRTFTVKGLYMEADK